MKNEKQIVLFLRKGTFFNEVQVAAKINEKFSDLGIPVILPYDEKKSDSPLIVFNKGIIKLGINYNDVTFVYDDGSVIESILDIIEYLEELDFTFVRFGYISTYIRTKKEKDKYLEREFKNPDAYDNEFNIARYKSELIDSVRVNVWERNMTDKLNKIDFATIVDINTPVDEEYNITREFLEDFIKPCDKYIEEILN